MTDDEWIDELLRQARRNLGMQLAYVAAHVGADVLEVEHVDGALDTLVLPVGAELDYQASVCARVVGAGPAAAVADLAADPRTRDLAVRRAYGLGSYIGAPIQLSRGGVYGMLCCYSTETRPDLAEAEARTLEFVAGIIGRHLDTTGDNAAWRAATTRRIRSVLDGDGPTMVYQATFDLPSLAVSGWEALSRFPAGWGGPDRWFADAAEVGLGVELELAAIRTAMANLSLFPDGARLSVNASPAVIADPRFLDYLCGVDPRTVLVEITEHDKIDDYQALRQVLGAVRSLDIPVAADDAGAGYAGLRHLVELQPSCIKLDRSIIENLDADPARRAVVTAMAAFAQDIGSTVLAEGVETPAELSALDALGVHGVQGFLLHRPEEPHAAAAVAAGADRVQELSTALVRST